MITTINKSSTMTTEIKTKTNYHVTVNGTGEHTIAWKGTNGTWANYEDPKITYNEEDLTIGDLAE